MLVPNLVVINYQNPHRGRMHLQGACPPMVANQDASRGLCSIAFEDQGEPFNQGQFDPTAQIHLRGLYKQGPWPLEK